MADLRSTRTAWMARFAVRPSLHRLSQFDEIDPMEEVIALVEQAEGDLTGLTAEELAALRSALATAYGEIRPTVSSQEQVAALTTVVDALNTVDGEATRRETEAAEVEAALAGLDAQIEAPPAAGAEGAPEGAPAAGEGEQAPAEQEPAEGTPAEGTPAEGEPAGQVPAEQEPQAVAASARRPSLSTLRRVQRQGPEPRPDPQETGDGIRLRGNRVVASANFAEIGNGAAFSDADQLGRTIARAAQDLVVQNPTGQKHYLGRVTLGDRARVVAAADFVGEDEAAVIDAAVKRNREQQLSEASRIVASGGVCVPPQPDYTITTVGDRGASWADSLPTVQGTRPIQFFPWINMSLRDTPGSRVGARPTGGIGIVTAAQDAAGYGSGEGQHLPKDCVRIDCPTPVSSVPEAQFQCVTVGNFQAITFPEYVRAFDDIVGFYFDVERDEKFLAKFVAAAKHLHASSGATFGAARDLLDVIRRLVAHVRSVRKAPGMAFRIDLPVFAKDMIAQDLADSWSDGTTNMRISTAQALALLSIDEGITIGEYAVSIGATANGSPTTLTELATNTTLHAWPDQIRILAYPDGSVWRQDYGELAFGLRETGMATNDFSAFYETFEQMNTRTTDLFTLDVDLCVNGAFGAAIAKTCAAVTSE